MKSTAHLATKMCPRPQVGGFKAVLLHYLLYANCAKSQAVYAKSVDGGEYDNNKHHRRGDAHRKRAGIRRAFSLGAHGG